MNATTTERPDVQAYLAAVRRELADLRPTERDELLADVETSLLDAAEETDAPIAARLGPPADFAAELRSAAGLSTHEPARATAASRFVDVWRNVPTASLMHMLRELAPIWWLARAYVPIALLAWLVDADRDVTAPDVFRIAGPNAGFVVLASAVAVSLAVGLWERRNAPLGRLALALNLLFAAAAVPAYADLLDWISTHQPRAAYTVEAVPTPGLARDGMPVENIYPYSRDGRLLLDVLLFDQHGVPLGVRPGDSDPTRRVLRARSGATFFNSFPIRYYEPGSRRVARPLAAPTIQWPQRSPIVTPPLRKVPSARGKR